MAVTKKLVSLVFVCVVVLAATAFEAQAAINCGQVAKAMGPCLGYLRNQGPLRSECCSGVKGLAAAARTTPDRQAACQCLKTAASNNAINAGRAASLPQACGVNIPYKISASVNCRSIK